MIQKITPSFTKNKHILDLNMDPKTAPVTDIMKVKIQSRIRDWWGRQAAPKPLRKEALFSRRSLVKQPSPAH